jgi:hypothetical protein
LVPYVDKNQVEIKEVEVVDRMKEKYFRRVGEVMKEH